MQELIDQIYLAMGVTEDQLPLTTVTSYLTFWIAEFPDNDCQVIYNTILSCYGWLIRNANANSNNGKRRERNGKREIEVQDTNQAQSWEDALANFKKAPWEALPQCKDELSSNVRSRIIIGGVRKDEYDRVKDNSNSRNQYNEKSPFSPRPNRYRCSRKGNLYSYDEDDDC